MSVRFSSMPRRQAASGARSTGRDSATSRWRRPPSDGPRMVDRSAGPRPARPRMKAMPTCGVAGNELASWTHENGPRGGHSLSVVCDTWAKTLAAVPFPLSDRHTVAGFALGARDAITPASVGSLDDDTGSNAATLLDYDARPALFLDAYGRRTDAHVNVNLSQLDGSCARGPCQHGRGRQHGG